jgi:hypothetical protein
MENIIRYYKDLLGIDLNDFSHPISIKINSITGNSSNDEKIKMHHLRELGLALLIIKNYDENVYHYYLKRIVKNSDISIYGQIFEIKQCAFLIEKAKEEDLDFRMGDVNLGEPDFFINDCGFEITSVRFSESSLNINPGNKLLNKFRDKNRKKYATKNTALLIDISEVTYQTYVSGQPVDQSLDDIKKIIKSEMKFGVVLCFIEWVDFVENKIYLKGTVYPEYSLDCSDSLKEIVDKKIIKGMRNEFNGAAHIFSNK